MSDLPPNMGYPIGTRLRLEGEESQWSLIEVRGVFNYGPDNGGWVLVIAPVHWGEGDNSPRNVDPDKLAGLGYVVETVAAPTPTAWGDTLAASA